MKKILSLLFVLTTLTTFAQRDVYIKGKLDVNATVGGIIFRLGSDATGDLYTRNASGYFSRIAVGTTGAFLRAGTTPSWSTLTIPNTISANSIFVSNSANTLVELTPAAGQSIRRNAGGTAWEAYTPGGGSSVSFGTTRQIPYMNSGSTDFSYATGFEFNSVSSELLTPGVIRMGGTFFHLASPSSSTISTESSTGTNAGITFRNKGSSEFIFDSPSAGSSTRFFDNGTTASIYLYAPNTTKRTLSISGASNTGGDGHDINIVAGNSGFTNGNGGNVILSGGLKNGTGTVGSVSVSYGSTGSFKINGLVESVLLSGTTLSLNDDLHRGKIIYCTSSSAVTITLPSGLPLGFQCTIVQDGTGTVSITTSGTTLNGKSSTTAQYDGISIAHYKSSETYIGM